MFCRPKNWLFDGGAIVREGKKKSVKKTGRGPNQHRKEKCSMNCRAGFPRSSIQRKKGGRRVKPAGGGGDVIDNK